MKFSPLMAHLGAAVSDLDIRKPLTNAEKEALKQALIEHHVLLFQSGELTPQEQITFSQSFGDLEKFPWRPSQLKGLAEIFRLANHHEDGYENVGMYWHSDGSFRDDATPISIFHLTAVPEKGGDTGFTNLKLAWETLPDKDKQRIANLKAVIGIGGVVQPLVQRHPVTGHEILYLNIGLTDGILGLSPKEGEEIVQLIDDHFNKEDLNYFHQWRPGDLIVADNFGVAHKATPIDKSERRILHRTTVSSNGVWWNKQAA